MNRVFDASILVAALVDNDPHGAWALRVIHQSTLYAPELVLVEATNILRRLELAKQITSPEATAAHDDLMQLDIELLSFEPCAERIWQLRHTVTSYDAWYVAAAERLDVPLVTLDKRLAKAKGPKCKFVTPDIG